MISEQLLCTFLPALRIGVKLVEFHSCQTSEKMSYATAEDELQGRERARAVTYERGENCK